MGQSLLNALSSMPGAPVRRLRDSAGTGFKPRHWPQPMVKRGSTALRIILSHTCARAASNTTVQCSSLKVCPKRLGRRIEIGIRPVTRAQNIHTSAVRRLLSHTTATATRPVPHFRRDTWRFCLHPNFWWIDCGTFQVASSSYPKVSNSELPAACIRMPWWS